MGALVYGSAARLLAALLARGAASRPVQRKHNADSPRGLDLPAGGGWNASRRLISLSRRASPAVWLLLGVRRRAMSAIGDIADKSRF